MKKILGLLLISLYSFAALADQCAWMNGDDQKYVVVSAKKQLHINAEFVDYCAPCKDEMGKVQKVEESNIEYPKMGSVTYDGKDGKEKFLTVKVNGKETDLAYMYVRTGTRVFGNVAMLVGCPVSDVPPFLYTAPGKRPTPVEWKNLPVFGDRGPSSLKKDK